jgi:hypothetical protein
VGVVGLTCTRILHAGSATAAQPPLALIDGDRAWCLPRKEQAVHQAATAGKTLIRGPLRGLLVDDNLDKAVLGFTHAGSGANP